MTGGSTLLTASMIRFAVLFSLFLISYVESAAGRESQASVSVVHDSVRIVGPITAKTAQRFAQITSQQDVRRLDISSMGGENLSALRMGRIIWDRHMTVIVSGICMSACASYIFLPAARRQVRPNSLVIFHHTANSLMELARVHHETNLSKEYAADAQLAKQLLIARGVSLLLLYEPQVQMDPLCYAVIPTQLGKEVAYVSGSEGWVPPRESLAKAGVQVEGFWPNSIDEFARTMRVLLSREIKLEKDGKFRIVFGHPQVVRSMFDVDDVFVKVPQCAVKRG
jgi:hypothetical protein